ncbi:hypothetical protein DFH07DRAFT_952612 [Mycena maculata]|uniref:Uncharacterized protein n=1 Tax=Mycena maculata TaxID=230809 RepID=A0AAD7JZ53_9AGAR|nr:hypothetical protein DFH07DRAFT_952612 [Mycena maculata]
MRTLSLSLVLSATLSSALVNITVDDSEADSSIHFTSENCVALPSDETTKSWQVSPGRFVQACHARTLRRCDGAVTFKFTGVAVYLLYPPWPHEMNISAILDSNPATLLTISEGDSVAGIDASSSSEPAWGLSGLPNTEHTLTLARQDPGDSFYLDAFMYTALCNAEPCDRRRRKGDSEGSDSDTTPNTASSAVSSAGFISPTPTSSSPLSTSPIASLPTSISPTSSTPAPSSPITSAESTLPPTITPSQSASPHFDTVRVALGTVLGVLLLVLISLFVWRYRRRRRNPIRHNNEDKPARPDPASHISLAESTRPPSMRERSDRFSDTHTPAGTPLTRTPASVLTALSSMAHLAYLKPDKVSQSSPSVNVSSLQEDERFEVPPPEYKTLQ